jgi:serine/threonine protein kinase
VSTDPSLASIAMVPTQSAIQPAIIGRYALFDEIASGGMATVYFGRLIGAAGFARQVAIKRLSARLVADDATRAMFVDEARLGARIHHPNVVQTLDVVSHGSELLIVMEYVHGETLGRLAKAARARGQHVPVPIAVAVATDMLHGLHAAHEARTEDEVALNIVHRDVSPQNVIVGRDGVSRVLDFGIARADVRSEETRSGIVKGKVAYMSPEQILGEAVTRQTDIFAAGVVLWELLTGRRLLLGGENGDSLQVDMLLRGAFEPPSRYRPSLDPAIDAIVMCALDRDPAARFASASEMARTLEGVSIVGTTTQVGEWVQSLAGDALADRGRKLSAFERADSPRSMNEPPVASRDSRPGETPAVTPARAGSSRRTRIALVAASFILGMACMAGANWIAHQEESSGAAPTKRSHSSSASALAAGPPSGAVAPSSDPAGRP